jgi:diguanylate cyclase (GGDEF)-like protein
MPDRPALVEILLPLVKELDPSVVVSTVSLLPKNIDATDVYLRKDQKETRLRVSGVQESLLRAVSGQISGEIYEDLVRAVDSLWPLPAAIVSGGEREQQFLDQLIADGNAIAIGYTRGVYLRFAGWKKDVLFYVNGLATDPKLKYQIARFLDEAELRDTPHENDVLHDVAAIKAVLRFLKRAVQKAAEALPTQHIDLDEGMKIPSRKQMTYDLEKAFAFSEQENCPLALLFIDYDDLRKLNKAIGHPEADKVLHAVAQCIRKDLKGRGEVYRRGGDELLVILPNFELLEAEAVAERLRTAVESLPHVPHTVRSTITIGVAAYPETVKKHQELEKAADDALMLAKKEGKNRIGLSKLVSGSS